MTPLRPGVPVPKHVGTAGYHPRGEDRKTHSSEGEGGSEAHDHRGKRCTNPRRHHEMHGDIWDPHALHGAFAIERWDWRPHDSLRSRHQNSSWGEDKIREVRDRADLQAWHAGSARTPRAIHEDCLPGTSSSLKKHQPHFYPNPPGTDRFLRHQAGLHQRDESGPGGLDQGGRQDGVRPNGFGPYGWVVLGASGIYTL